MVLNGVIVMLTAYGKDDKATLTPMIALPFSPL